MVPTNSPPTSARFLRGPLKEPFVTVPQRDLDVDDARELSPVGSRHSTGSLCKKLRTGEAAQKLSCSPEHSPRIPRSDAYRNYRRKCHYLLNRDRSNSLSSADSSYTGATEPHSKTNSTTDLPVKPLRPIKSHPDMMPLNTLAMLLSEETTRAVKIGLYSSPDMGALRRQREPHGMKRETKKDIFEILLTERRAAKAEGTRLCSSFSNIMDDLLDASNK